MKDNYIHVCFVIDESGSMSGSESDVINGFKKVLDEQKANTEGQCSISLYKFSNSVSELYIGRDVHDVTPLHERAITGLWDKLANGLTIKTCDYVEESSSDCVYCPSGCTAMFDGIGTAIDNIGKWLSDMPEDERPSKNLIVIMTDGAENASSKYSASQIKEMIKHQEEKYNWSFVYMGTDITTTSYADSIGIKNQAYVTKAKHDSAYNAINCVTTSFRNASADDAIYALDACMTKELGSLNAEYLSDTGLDMTKK